MPTKSRLVRESYARYHYEKHKAVYKKRALEHKRKTARAVRAFLREYLASHPCVDCGESDPLVLEFDHRDPRTKIFALGNGASGSYTMRRVRAEIAKCDVRCANCHRRRTHKQRIAGEFGETEAETGTPLPLFADI